MKDLMKKTSVGPSIRQTVRSENFNTLSPLNQIDKSQRNHLKFVVNSTKILSKTEKNRKFRSGHQDYDDEGIERVNFPDITSSPSYINTYLADARNKLTIPNFMNQKRQLINHSQAADQDHYNRRSKYDRAKFFNKAALSKTQMQNSKSPSISRIQRSLDSDQSLTSLDNNFGHQKKQSKMNRDSNFSPNLNITIPKISTNSHNVTFSDVLMKSKTTLKDYQNINQRHFPMIKPSLRVSIDDQEKIIFGETQYHNPFMGSNVRSSLRLQHKESIDEPEYYVIKEAEVISNEELALQTIRSPKQKELTVGRFKVDIALSQDRDRLEKEWMKKANPRVYKLLQDREDFETKMIIKKKKRIEVMNLSNHQ
ncbi:UNKNOWN [Stylonychia lemnae]|uniref:Uncharacterized protein n=1 Tax=Stylonychia lemnae TaxID=5949 RepID=A0A077ZVC8_STYLE|nr:UNKNOWN [Stylonychia lemnae]|eukprot:CDW73855.1 UNKNOWN [Stylonychia lemnae]